MRQLRVAVLAALLTPLATASLTAQSWKWDLGGNVGYSYFSKLLTEDATRLPDAASASEIKFAKGFMYGGQLTLWPSAKLGVRLNGRFGGHDIKGNDLGSFDFVEDVGLHSATADLMFRFKAPAEEFTKMEMLPYLALGAGAKWIVAGHPDINCVDPTDGDSFSCGIFITGLGPGGARTPATRTWGIRENTRVVGHVGLGADWRLSRNFALRTEISDQIFRPSVSEVRNTSGNNYTQVDDENLAKVIHNLAGQVGLHFLFGVPRPAAVAVAAPVAPPAEPAPVPTQPAAPPPERTEAITVCVIDPTATGGIRMQTATFYPTRGDTMISVNGQNVLLRNAVGNVMVASNADWYVRAQPLTMTVGTEKVEFVTTGSARTVEASELAFLGTINGMAVYADADDVKDVIGELNDIRKAQNNNDLAKILGEQKDLRDELEDVKVLYVPLQPTGCVFQAVQRQEAVRKNR